MAVIKHHISLKAMVITITLLTLTLFLESMCSLLKHT